MNESDFCVRRAILEDLPQLSALWEMERLPADDLEKRFTEFQVVTAGAEGIVASLGLQISGAEGKLHSEAIARPELSEVVRNLLWRRVESLAANHGLARLWTQLQAPFWRDQGFQQAPQAAVGELPRELGGGSQTWFRLTLREEHASPHALDKHFALLKAMSREETERTLRRAKTLKMIALAITALVLGLLVIWGILMIKLGPKLKK